MKIVTGTETAGAEYVRKKLIEYNSVQTPPGVPHSYEEVNLLLKDEGGQIFGGIVTAILWNFMQVDVLWVDESARGKGYGTQLLSRVEAVARERGCVCVQLDTFSFQAPDFYREHGYEPIGALEYIPGKFARYYMVKWLN